MLVFEYLCLCMWMHACACGACACASARVRVHGVHVHALATQLLHLIDRAPLRTLKAQSVGLLICQLLSLNVAAIMARLTPLSHT